MYSLEQWWGDYVFNYSKGVAHRIQLPHGDSLSSLLSWRFSEFAIIIRFIYFLHITFLVSVTIIPGRGIMMPGPWASIVKTAEFVLFLINPFQNICTSTNISH